MIGNHNQLLALQQRASDALKDGRSIAIIGWKDSNHNVFTRSLPQNRVTFFGDSPGNLSQNLGFILFTRFIAHALFERIKKAKARRHYHPIPLDIGQIKVILESCRGVLKPSMSHNATLPSAEVKTHELEHFSAEDSITHDGLLDFLTQPQPEIKEMTQMEKFAKAFQDSANQTAGKQVSSKTLGELRLSSGVTKTNLQLITAGWIEKVELDAGKTKAFWYRKGKLMLEGVNPEVPALPETAVGRAEALISRKPELIARKEQIAKDLQAIDATLEMIEAAEQMFSKIDQTILSIKHI